MENSTTWRENQKEEDDREERIKSLGRNEKREEKETVMQIFYFYSNVFCSSKVIKLEMELNGIL